MRATSVSICAGEAPGSEAVTVIVGSSMSGKFWIFIALKPSRPTSVSITNSRIAGMGLRIDQEETFIAGPYFVGRGPAWPAACAPASTTRTGRRR